MQEQYEIKKKITEMVTSQNKKELQEILQRFYLSLDEERDNKGNTLLIVATRMGAKDVVRLLLEYGVNPNI